MDKNKKERTPTPYTIVDNRSPNAWETPQHLFDCLHQEFDFTLDPCCYPDSAKCQRFFDKSIDGLKQSWAGERVWMNPPYSRDLIGKFMEKAHRESRDNGALVVALVPLSGDTAWWHDHVIGAAAEVWFLRGRVQFLRQGRKGPNSPRFASVIVIYWPDEIKNETCVYSSATITRGV